jgi:hypothetical protein
MRWLPLKAEGRPLSGFDIVLEHKTYNWNDPTSLAQLVRELTSQSAIVAASLEGALFEYGSDEAIMMNSRALWAAGTGARLVAGSVTSADAFRRRMIAITRFKLTLRRLRHERAPKSRKSKLPGLATRFCCVLHERQKASFPRPPASFSILLPKLRTLHPDYSTLLHCPW